MKSPLVMLLGTILATLVFTQLAVGEEKDSDERAEQRNAWSDYYAAQLPRYRFSLKSSPGEPFELPVAALRWSNPLRPGTHGDLFVWSHDGRGVLVGSIFSYPNGENRKVAHQFQSLTMESIECEHQGGVNFSIPGPGLAFETIPLAPVPAENKRLRLTQMRALAREFEAYGTSNDVLQPLRMLEQPIFRFKGDQISDDGAIFAFVMGTDPELLLVLSALPSNDGVRWQYAGARFAADPLKLILKGNTIWEFGDTSKHLGYVSRHGIDLQPDLPVIETPQN